MLAVKDDTRVPVDAKVVVSRTRDAGKTWEVLDRGLPAPPAYDIAFRHALDVDDQGTTLALGSTTGLLWVTEDSGDQWTCLSAHLPDDRGTKFLHYQAIVELQDYVIVSHRLRRIDHYRREGDGHWRLTTTTRDDGLFELATLGGPIVLADTYAGVDLDEGRTGS